MCDDESILTHFQAVGHHRNFHLPTIHISNISVVMVWTPEGHRGRTGPRNVKNLDVPEGKQRLSCGLYKGSFDSPVTQLNTIGLLLESEETKTHHTN